MKFFDRIKATVGITFAGSIDNETKDKLILKIYNDSHNTTHDQIPGYCVPYENFKESRMELSSDILFGVINGLLVQAGLAVAGSMIIWEGAQDATHLRLCDATGKIIIGGCTVASGTLAMAFHLADSALKPVKVVTRSSATAVMGCKKTNNEEPHQNESVVAQNDNFQEGETNTQDLESGANELKLGVIEPNISM